MMPASIATMAIIGNCCDNLADPQPARIQELNMSGINGDKSRFHRQRKQKIERRKRNRELLKNLMIQPKQVVAASEPRAKTEAK
jgi:hypothetical protein